MEKTTNKETNSSRLPNGAILKKAMGKNMPEKDEMDEMIELVTKSMPKAAKFLKSNWKPVAIATASIAAVAVGAYSFFGKPKSTKKS